LAITPDTLREASELIGSATSLRAAAALLRARDPARRVVLVDAMDMRDEVPAARVGACSIFLASSNGHCWSITQHCDEATALILTQD
jgi:hypothetical protein